jgi:hypothetical protein
MQTPQDEKNLNLKVYHKKIPNENSKFRKNHLIVKTPRAEDSFTSHMSTLTQGNI